MKVRHGNRPNNFSRVVIGINCKRIKVKAGLIDKTSGRQTTDQSSVKAGAFIHGGFSLHRTGLVNTDVIMSVKSFGSDLSFNVFPTEWKSNKGGIRSESVSEFDSFPFRATIE